MIESTESKAPPSTPYTIPPRPLPTPFTKPLVPYLIPEAEDLFNSIKPTPILLNRPTGFPSISELLRSLNTYFVA